MAELKQIEAPILPTVQIPNIDFSSAYVAVGNELNKRYWQNRQLYMESIVNPLANVEADEWGQDELNKIKGDIDKDFSEFEASGQWHHAGNKIYDTAKKINTNQTLKYIIKSKANYDAFVKNVQDSKWSTADKEGFMLRAHHASSKITTDENGMPTGGFTPIAIGDPYDINEFTQDILSKLEKVKADKVSVSQLINDPAQLEAYGLPSVVDNNGRTLISHIVEQTVKKEFVTAEDLARSVQSIAALNPEIYKQLSEEKTNTFYRKYYDKASKTFKDIPEEDVHKVIAHKFYTDNNYNEAQTYIETALDLNPSAFLIEDNLGGYIYNPDKITNYNSKNKECLTKFGITLDELYTKGVDDNVVSKVIKLYTNNELQKLRLDPTKPEGKDLIKELVLSKDIQNAWKEYITGITGTAISLYAYEHVEQSNKFIDNPAYKAYLNNYYKYSLKPTTNGYDPSKPSSVDENGMIDYTNFLSSNLEQINRLSEDKNIIIASDNSIIEKLTEVDNPLLVTLGFIKDGKIDKGLLQSTDLAKLDETARKNGYYDTDNYKAIRESIIGIRANKDQLDIINGIQESYKFNAKTLYDDYNKESEIAKKNNQPNYYHGAGWYGIASDIAKFIANNNITSVEEFREAVSNSQMEDLQHSLIVPDNIIHHYKMIDPENNHYRNTRGFQYMTNISDEDIRKEISNVLDNIQHRYEKKTGEPFQWAQQSHSITNPNYTLQTRLEGRKSAWQAGTGNLQTISLADGSGGNKVLPSDIAALINLNQFPVSVNINEKGETVTERNITTDKSTPIKKDVFKTKNDVYKTEIRFSLNPLEQSQGFIAYDIICRDKSNAYCGTVKVREQTDDINEYLLDVYEQFKPLADAKNSNGKKAVGVVINNIGETSYVFKSADSQPAKGLTELKNNVENMYRLGKNGYTYTLEAKSVYSESDVINPIPIKITKVSDGYIIEDLSQKETSKKGIFTIPTQYQDILGLTGCDTGWNGQKVFPTLDLAFASISTFNLQLSAALRRIDKETKQ